MMYTIYYVFWDYLASNPFSQEMDPYLETVNLSFIFTWDDGETEDHAKFSTSSFFEWLLINNTELRGISMKTTCMAMQMEPGELRQNWRIHMFWDYLINRLYLQKINLKRPISRDSRFKIYLFLECRRNRGSRQNFHEIIFSKDRILIKPDHIVTYHLLWSYAYLIKTNNLYLSMDART